MGKGRIRHLDDAYVYLALSEQAVDNVAEARKAFAKLKDVPNKLYSEAIAAAQAAKAINPDLRIADRQVADSYLAMGRNDLARQMCESPATMIADDNRHFCLALAYHALRMPAEAQAEVQKLRALGWGDARADSYAYVYAQWGDTRAALDWLATAERTRASALQNLKVRWFLDPIRNEPEFKALESRLNFPP